ncbi:MAG: o-succinylbenzoate synthase [Puniceicoccales bacterium]|jgi:O-succinylbenzoate synthase|nr:o-succinylbenzoate synthase [Puniceicoccales bacterium]
MPSPSDFQPTLRYRWFRYRRRFRRPLRTGGGEFREREGLLLRVQNEETGAAGFGEVAPWHGFRGERVADAARFLREREGKITGADALPATLPLLRGAVEMALENAVAWREPTPPVTLRSAILLPRDAIAGVAAAAAAAAGLVFKAKILGADSDELERARRLLDALPAGARLRLDANGAFGGAENTAPVLSRWAPVVLDPRVDFLEQPFPAEQMPLGGTAGGTGSGDAHEKNSEFLRQVGHKIALDESVSLATELPADWNGALVVKPLLLGSRRRWREWRRRNPKTRVIFSSCFESALGREDALRLGAGDSTAAAETHGFGTLGFFFADAAATTDAATGGATGDVLELHADSPAGLARSLGWETARWDNWFSRAANAGFASNC